MSNDACSIQCLQETVAGGINIGTQLLVLSQGIDVQIGRDYLAVNIQPDNTDGLAPEYGVPAAGYDAVFDIQKVRGQYILAGFLYGLRTIGKLA